MKHPSVRVHRGIKLEYYRHKTIYKFNFLLSNKTKLITWIFIYRAARIYKKASSKKDEHGGLTSTMLSKVVRNRFNWCTLYWGQGKTKNRLLNTFL